METSLAIPVSHAIYKEVVVKIPEKITFSSEDLRLLYESLSRFRAQGLKGDMRLFREVAVKLKELVVSAGLYRQPPNYINDKWMFEDLKRLSNLANFMELGLREGSNVVYRSPLDGEFQAIVLGLTSDCLVKIRTNRSFRPVVSVNCNLNGNIALRIA